ncbi:prostaglandin E synthase 2-like [Acanthaster planci]|uniref:Prostaglandin E synthase 2 n=1 Tax=Acanthaster planci TaxID=133434 RepID=A0A8B7XWN1_ACAPL|nr:prostaglandin E synthase 2-like [Acanthaster planci]
MATYTITRNILRSHGSVHNPRKFLLFAQQNITRKPHVQARNIRNVSDHFGHDYMPEKSMSLFAGLGIASGVFLSSYILKYSARRRLCTASAQSSERNETSQRFLSDVDASRLKLTLYQYEVCPFCCKLRAFLDFYGVPYDVVEVDPIRRKELKFSKYRKVPILIQEGPANEKIQLNDSSVIISALTTYMSTDEKDFLKIVSYFPQIEIQDKKGRKSIEFGNKYEIMTGMPGRTVHEKEEKKWREWVDGVLVHYIPPNIYRSPSESLQAFSYISSHGKYSTIEQFVIKYAGAVGMFFVAKKLKKKYSIPDDVRSCLYSAAYDWINAVGTRKFMGGDKPNLADLAVYGVLSSIEGLDAFNDMLQNTNIGPWYHRTKKAVKSTDGAR